jgi:hypothetical protein
MTNVGYFAVVAYGCDEVIYFIKNYLANKLWMFHVEHT